jgi:hypothetical protein
LPVARIGVDLESADPGEHQLLLVALARESLFDEGRFVVRGCLEADMIA